MAEHPMQPLEHDPDGYLRFKANPIVRFLLTFSRGKGVGLCELGEMPWSQEDWDQFYQLIGTSLDGYHEKSLISDGAKAKATIEQSRVEKNTG